MYTGGSLFSGQEGIGLAMRDAGILPRWHVEIDEWCRELLALRFPRNKIFEDVHNVGQHNLTPVDVIFGGFPCQPISQAGSRRGTADERWLWPEFARVVREVRPAVVFLENSDKITTPIRDKETKEIIEVAPAYQVLASLAEMGFDAEWGIVPASAAGAPHKRDRWWCFAWNISNANSIRQRRETRRAETGQDTSHSQRESQIQSCERAAEFYEAVTGSSLSNSNGDALKAGYPQYEQRGHSAVTRASGGIRYTQREGLEGAAGKVLEESEVFTQRPELQQIRSSHESDLGRIVFDGLPSRLERQARTQLYASRLGMQPYPFEPSRLTDDTFDWKDRTQAIGNSVCVPVVYAFAEGIKSALDELYKES